jgi:phage shock protein A
MGLFDRLGRVVRANLNDLVSKAEDPEKILEQAIIDMQEDLVQLRQAVAQVIASQKRTEQQYNKNQAEANSWQQRAQLALSKGDEDLARQALQRKKAASDTAGMLKQQLDQQFSQSEQMKKNLIALESKIGEAKTKKEMLKARAKAAQANKQLQSAVSSMGTSSAMGAFERMEDKVLSLEAESQSAYELAGTGLESQFAQLEAGSDVDYELEMMKAQLTGGSVNQGALPSSSTAQPEKSASPVDTELEQLRQQLDKM